MAKQELDSSKFVYFFMFFIALIGLQLSLSERAQASLFAQEDLHTYKHSVKTAQGLVQIHFHYHSKERAILPKFTKFLEADVAKLTEYFAYAPKDIVHVVFNGKNKIANGFETNFPRNLIVLNLHVPMQEDHLQSMDDWWRGLLFHEMVHMVHLERTDELSAVVEKIFGTVGKIIPADVPRWFTEGVAVWAESHFLAGGRLKHLALDSELYDFILKNKSRLTIDRLDEPGLYPHGALAYWIGGHFLAFLEQKRPTTVSCLVRENAHHAMFRLNLTFDRCLGQKVAPLFAEFLDDFVGKRAASGRASAIKNEFKAQRLASIFGKVDLEKGMTFLGDNMYVVEKKPREEALVMYDLVDKVGHLKKFSAPIVRLPFQARNHGVDKNDHDTEDELLVSFTLDPERRNESQHFYSVGAETFSTRELNIPVQSVEHVIALNHQNVYTWSFEKFKWVMRSFVLENGAFREKFKFEFPDYLAIKGVYKLEQKIILKMRHYKKEEELLAEWPLALDASAAPLEKLKVLYRSKFPFEVTWQAPNELGFKSYQKSNDSKWQIIQATPQGYHWWNFDAALLPKEVSRVYFSDQFVALYAGEFFIWDKKQWDEKWQNKELAFEEVHFNTEEPLLLNEFSSSTELAALKEKEKRYLTLSHFKPHYWFLNFDTGSGLSNIGASTSFSDPMDIHRFSLYGHSYFEHSIFGGGGSYAYAEGDYVFQMAFDKGYSAQSSSLANDLASDAKLSLSLTREFYRNQWSFFPSIVFGSQQIKDFISQRKNLFFGASFNAQYSALTRENVLSAMSFYLRTVSDQIEGYNPILNLQSSAQIKWRLRPSLTMENFLSYGNLFKSDYSRGVLYAGGGDSFDRTRLFGFYPIAYGDAFGNVVKTFRTKFDYLIMDIYKGNDLYPFFVRDWSLQFGSEWLSTDRIYSDQKRLSDKTLQSYFMGSKFALTLFYHLPANLELLASSFKKQSGENHLVFNLNLNLGGL